MVTEKNNSRKMFLLIRFIIISVLIIIPFQTVISEPACTEAVRSGRGKTPFFRQEKTEGPFVNIIDSLTIEVICLKYPDGPKPASVIRDTVQAEDLPRRFNGVLIEPSDISTEHASHPVESDISDVKEIFVIGDIHGEYDRVVRLLLNNGIIDTNLEWKWGCGHLVFMGDIFDRGTEVTETLWLIYNLEKSARKKGGRVHLILGNHENMIFRNDLRYVADEYMELCSALGLNYPDLFGSNTILGRWLRQKPLMMKINGYTFLHAGISPELFRTRLTIDTINSIVYRYLNNSEISADVAFREMILGRNGILWYRGMVDDGENENIIDSQTLADALKFYDTKAFVIGHTEVDSIVSFFDGKVIDVNIPKRKERIPEQGLLIDKNGVRVVYEDQSTREL